MAQSGYTPIQLYYSSTTTTVPLAANLANGELAINITDGKLFYKDNSGVVQTIATKTGATATVSSVAISGGTTGLTTSGGPITTSGTITFAGTLVAANGGTGQTSYTAGDTLYASGTTTLSKLGIGSTGQVLTVSGGVPSWQTPASGLPSQTGNAGKYLTTDGTNASWAFTGASAGGVIWENSLVVSSNYTLTTGKNGFSVGPITINSGVTVTVPSGQRWVIL